MKQIASDCTLKKMVVSTALMVACSCLCSEAAIANENIPAAGKWLNKMTRALQQSDYQGYFLFENQDDLQTFRISNNSISSRRCERLVSLDGPYLEMVRYGKQLAYISDQDRPANQVKDPSFFIPFKADYQQMSKYYDLRYTGDRRVSGRNAAHVEITPKDKYRHGFQLWIDHENNIPLKWVMQTPDNKLLERFQFMLLDTSSTLFETDCTLPSGHQWMNTSSSKPKESNRTFLWRINWMPEGFTLVHSGKAINPINKQPADYTLYSDSLSSFSVLVEVAGQDKGSHMLNKEQMGATAVVIDSFHLDGHNYRVTVIGELPLIALERIAASVAGGSGPSSEA